MYFFVEQVRKKKNGSLYNDLLSIFQQPSRKHFSVKSILLEKFSLWHNEIDQLRNSKFFSSAEKS